MSKNIKGITISIDGDTTGLTQALKKVDNETKNVQNELKQVDRLLKFDPSNTELLAQKQKLLGDAIDSTSKRLNTLKQAQGEVERQFKNGEIGEEAFRKFQREIIATEGKLKAFQKQANATDIKIEAKADTSAIDKMKNSLKELGPAAKQAASEIGSALGNAGAAAAAGVGALVVGSTDLNNDLARLRTNAQIAGRDLGLVEDAFKQITAVTGETDSAVETVSNLLASGFKDNQLQAVIEGINGAAIKFSDTLKTEGIADGIQETFATGEAIGMFAELLERSGVDLEAFNEKLAVAKKNGTETDLALQTMSELGLTQVNDKYKELNPELVKNNEATVQMQTALADLAIVLTPLVTMVAELVTKFVEWATANPQLSTTLATIAGVIGSIAGAFALLGPVVSSISSLWGVLSRAVMSIIGPLTSASGATTALGTVFSFLTGPIGIAIAAITAIVGALVVAYNKVEWFRDGVNEIWDKIKDYTSKAFNAVKDLVSELISDAVDFAKDVLNDFKKFWDENGKAITNMVKTYFGQIKSNIETAMKLIQGVFQVIWPIISGVVKTTWEYMQLTIGSAIKLILGVIQATMKILQGDWKGAWETIKSTAEGIMNNVVKFFKDIDLTQIGKDIIQGLINGIGSMSGAVMDKARSLANSVKDTISGALKIKSPSRVMIGFGENIGEGLVIGMDDMVRKVAHSSERLSGAVISAHNSLSSSSAKSEQVRLVNSTVSSSTIDNSKYMQPQIQIIVQGDNASPSEIARKALQAQRQLAMEWGV